MALMVTATAAAGSTSSAHRVEGNVGSPVIGSGSVGDVLGAVPPVAAAVLVVRVAPVAAGCVHVLAVGRGCWNGGKLWQNGNWGIIGNILTTT